MIYIIKCDFMTISIEVELMGALNRYEGKKKFNLSIQKDMITSQLLNKLNFSQADQKYLIVIVNDKQVKKSYILQENDSVFISILIGGG